MFNLVLHDLKRKRLNSILSSCVATKKVVHDGKRSVKLAIYSDTHSMVLLYITGKTRWCTSGRISRVDWSHLSIFTVSRKPHGLRPSNILEQRKMFLDCLNRVSFVISVLRALSDFLQFILTDGLLSTYIQNPPECSLHHFVFILQTPAIDRYVQFPRWISGFIISTSCSNYGMKIVHVQSQTFT